MPSNDLLAELLAHCRLREQSARYSAARARKIGGEQPGNGYYPRHAEGMDRLAAKWKRWGDALAGVLAADGGPIATATAPPHRPAGVEENGGGA